MAAVYEAVDLTLERSVAVKLLFARDERDKEAMAGHFLREARICAAVQHRNVVSIVDFGMTHSDTPFMVMELLRGISVADRLERDVVLSPNEAAQMGAGVLRGLHAVHGVSIVHRDLKPGNIFLVDDADGAFPKILDFGISRSADPSSGRKSTHTTREGLLVGTPDYMSPEQARGLRDIDSRTDIYSLGVILYGCVTGVLPYSSENVGDLVIMIAAGGAPPAEQVAPGIPRALSLVIEKAMARAREDRFQTAREMQVALVEAGREQGVSLRPPTVSFPVQGGEAQIHEVAARLSAEHRRDSGAGMNAPTGDTGFGAPPLTRRPWFRAAAVIALLATVSIGAVAATSGGDELATVEPVVSAPPSAFVEVRLANVPPGATVRLDQEVVGQPVVIDRDNARHLIEVTDESMEPWRVTHVASSDGDYLVAVIQPPATFVAEVEPDVEVAPEPRGRRGRRGKRGRMSSRMRMRSGMMRRPRTFRDLDY